METNSNDLSLQQLIQSMAERLSVMEDQLAATATSSHHPMDTSDPDEGHDPQIVERPPALDLIPSEILQQEFPGMQRDFFRSPLEDMARKRFIHVCPRNVIRQYTPPTVNMADNIKRSTKQHDNQLSEIQRRLVQLTRPLDMFMHESLRSNANHVSLEQTKDLVNTIHTLLSDVASHITQVRMDNICSDTGLVAPPIKPITQLAPTPTPLFEDPKVILEHTNLAKTVRSVTSKRSSKKRTNARHDNTQQSSRQANSGQQNSQYNSNSTGTTSAVTSNNQHRGHASPKRSTSSSGNSKFQQRPTTPHQQ